MRTNKNITELVNMIEAIPADIRDEMFGMREVLHILSVYSIEEILQIIENRNTVITECEKKGYEKCQSNIRDVIGQLKKLDKNTRTNLFNVSDVLVIIENYSVKEIQNLLQSWKKSCEYKPKKNDIVVYDNRLSVYITGVTENGYQGIASDGKCVTLKKGCEDKIKKVGEGNLSNLFITI